MDRMDRLRNFLNYCCCRRRIVNFVSVDQMHVDCWIVIIILKKFFIISIIIFVFISIIKNWSCCCSCCRCYIITFIVVIDCICQHRQRSSFFWFLWFSANRRLPSLSCSVLCIAYNKQYSYCASVLYIATDKLRLLRNTAPCLNFTYK